MLIEYRANRQRREVPDAVGERLIAHRIARAVDPASTPAYQTRAMSAGTTGPQLAPYGYKADGTPRKRPAPRKKSESQE